MKPSRRGNFKTLRDEKGPAPKGPMLGRRGLETRRRPAPSGAGGSPTCPCNLPPKPGGLRVGASAGTTGVNCLCPGLAGPHRASVYQRDPLGAL